MEGLSFENIWDKSIFETESILIDECLPLNCDFLIMELVRAFGYSVYQWNETGEHLKTILSKYNLATNVHSAYTTRYNSEEIIDDIYVQKMLGCPIKSKINIYRSSTATEKDYYDYDLIIKISKLKSGCSSKIDGEIKIFRRDKVFHNLKYKILVDRVLYFES